MKSKSVDYNKELEDLVNNLHEDKAFAQNSNNLNFSDLEDNSEYVSYDKKGFIGRNTNLVYRNKYVSTGSRLATTEVVDISEFGKKEETPAPAPEPEVKPVSDGADAEELKPEEKTSIDDLFSFFDEEDNDAGLVTGEQEEPKEEEKKKPVAAKPRKKKRALDIDIISGGQGGDII